MADEAKKDLLEEEISKLPEDQQKLIRASRTIARRMMEALVKEFTLASKEELEDKGLEEVNMPLIMAEIGGMTVSFCSRLEELMGYSQGQLAAACAKGLAMEAMTRMMEIQAQAEEPEKEKTEDDQEMEDLLADIDPKSHLN